MKAIKVCWPPHSLRRLPATATSLPSNGACGGPGSSSAGVTVGGCFVQLLWCVAGSEKRVRAQALDLQSCRPSRKEPPAAARAALDSRRAAV